MNNNDNDFFKNNNSNNKLNNKNNNNKNNLIMTKNSDVLYKFQYLLSIVLVGYFGIKIYLGSFNKYPNKFYEKNLVINSSDICNINNSDSVEEEVTNKSVQDNLVMNYFIPGLINNEINDIIITVSLISIVFVLTGMYNRKSFAFISITNMIFLFGYFIGLNAPLYHSFFEESNNESFVNYTYLIVFILLISFMALFSAYGAFHNKKFSMNNGLGGYIIYLIIIFLLIIGLIVNRKKIKTSNTIIYTTDCATKCNTTSNGAYQTSGEYVNVSMTFLSFILLFIFVHDPPNGGMNSLYYFINGIFLGVFVSGMSFYGFEYFLNKKPDNYCNNTQDCNNKNIKIGSQVLSYNDSNQLTVVKWLLGIVSVIVLIVVIYLFYNK